MGEIENREDRRFTMADVQVGQRVTWRHGTGGISAGINGGTVQGAGVVARIWDFRHDPPIGVHVDGTDGRRLHCVFAHELVTVEDPQPAAETDEPPAP